MLPELYGITSLEIKKVRQLDDKRPLHELAGNRVPAVIVDKVEVAQRMVNQVEADVGTHLMRVRIVLNERIKECTRVESVNNPGSDEFGCE